MEESLQLWPQYGDEVLDFDGEETTMKRESPKLVENQEWFGIKDSLKENSRLEMANTPGPK